MYTQVRRKWCEQRGDEQQRIGIPTFKPQCHHQNASEQRNLYCGNIVKRMW